MSSQRTRPTATRADLAARRTAGSPGAASVPEPQRLPRVVPVLTPPAPSAPRPFVVASRAPTGSASHATWPPRSLADVPAIRVARVTLERYLRSWWLLVDLVGIVVIWAIAFRRQVTPPSFFEAASLGLTLLAILGAYGILMVAPPRVYLRLIPHCDYGAALAGLVLANAVARAASALALLALTLIVRDLVFGTASEVVVGMLGLIASTVFVGTVCIVLAPPVVSRVWRVGAFVIVLLALYSYLDDGLVGHALLVTRVVLLPVAACYNMGQTGELGWSGGLALLVVAVLVAGMVVLAAFALARRHARTGSSRLHAPTTSAAGKSSLP